MPVPQADRIWFNGKLVAWEDATIHVLSHVVHYGSSVFEGMRCYETSKGPACFRLMDHVNRLFDSAKIYRMTIPYTHQELHDAVLETIKVNNLTSCYVRPIAFRGYGEMGVDPTKCPVDVVIAVWEWGTYLGQEALVDGVAVCFSSWNRLAPNTMPSLSKAGANYMNFQLIRMEANADGYAEGIALDVNGFVSEGGGENVFMVRNGSIYTPDTGSSILSGITRHSVIVLARQLGYSVTQRPIPRESLYIADEVFFTGSAAEVTPVTSIDKIDVGDGKRGPVTKALQEAYFGITKGEAEDVHEWLTFVE